MRFLLDASVGHFALIFLPEGFYRSAVFCKFVENEKGITLQDITSPKEANHRIVNSFVHTLAAEDTVALDLGTNLLKTAGD